MAAALTPRHASKDPQTWADKITDCIGQAVESILAMGMHLMDAKKALPHGQWERLFAGHPEAVKRPIKFSVSTAQRLMRIASNPVLSKAAYVQSLPPAWGTLYQLTKLEPDRLREAITDGRVHPEMERKDVKALRAPAAATPGVAGAEPREEWVSFSRLFGSGAIPKSAADVVQQAIDRMLLAGDIEPDARWKGLEWLAANYLSEPGPDDPQPQVIETQTVEAERVPF